MADRIIRWHSDRRSNSRRIASSRSPAAFSDSCSRCSASTAFAAHTISEPLPQQTINTTSTKCIAARTPRALP